MKIFVHLQWSFFTKQSICEGHAVNTNECKPNIERKVSIKDCFLVIRKLTFKWCVIHFVIFICSFIYHWASTIRGNRLADEVWIVLKELRNINPLKAKFCFFVVKKTLGSFFLASWDGNGKVGNIVSPPSHEAGSRLQADLRNCARLKKTNTKEKRQKTN